MDKQKWNDRYRESEFAFGTEPNQFLKEQLPLYTPSAILFPAEGEGRNAVWAAELNWDVTAFDQSEEGKQKALKLAEQKNVTINYLVDSCEGVSFENWSFDVIVFIYAHFSADKKAQYHKQLNNYLKPGGIVILEAFSKNHLEYRTKNPSVGGPIDLKSLYSEEEIMEYFHDFEIICLKTEVIQLSEGKYHDGQGSVVRFIGRKLTENEIEGH